MDYKEINALFAERGFRARLVTLERLADVEHEMAVMRKSDVHPTVYNSFLSRFQYAATSVSPKARSIILIAIPHPITEVSFTWQGEETTVIIPPVYLLTDEAKMIEQFLHESPILSKFSFSHARVPTKLLAVRSGLAQYGRNNIAYIKGLGSFYSLRAYFTDIEVEGDTWQEHEQMETCQHCRTCISNCPTGCISEERFLISAERCLTCLNELEGEFPDWVEQSWHNALVGCMECQNICPENANVLTNKQFLFTFSEEETRAILESETPLPQHVMEKLNRLGMQHYTKVLGRNLKTLLAKHS